MNTTKLKEPPAPSGTTENALAIIKEHDAYFVKYFDGWYPSNQAAKVEWVKEDWPEVLCEWNDREQNPEYYRES